VLLRLAYLGVTNMFALLRLLPSSDRDKDIEILALRHQITVLERQLGKTRPRFLPSDRAFLAALLHRLPRDVLGRFRPLVRPETRTSTTGTGPTGPWWMPHRYARSLNRLPIPSGSHTSMSADGTGPAAPSTSTGMLPDQHG
jgi:hypothetical protein